MRDIRNETGLLSETVGGLGRIGRNLTFAYTAPLTALATYAVQTAGAFDQEMRNINAIAQMPIEALQDLSEEVRNFSKETRTGATDTANALYTVFSAGLTDTETAMKAMKASVYTAEAGLSDVTTTTEALVATMLSFGDTSETFMQRASDSLTQMVAVGVGSMEEFAGGISQVLPTAGALGMEVEELFGNLAFLTQRGMSASRASTALNASLTSLVKPTEAMKNAFRELGAEGAEDLIEQFGGVNGALEALIGTTNGTQVEIQALFNNIRGARAINQFASDLDGWKASMEEFNSTVEGATMRAWEQQSLAFLAVWDRMKSALENTAIVIGNQIIPIITPLMTGFTDFLNVVTDINPALISASVAFVGMTMIIPPLVWAVTSLISPIGVLVAGLITLTGWVGSKTPQAFEELFSTVDGGTSSFDAFVDSLSRIFTPDVPTNGMDILQEAFDKSFEDGTLNVTDNITVDTPRSLWDIYESEGYSDMFSWQEFMQQATDGGWEGGAITPDSPIDILITAGDVIRRRNFDFDQDFGWSVPDQEAEEINPYEAFIGRFEEELPELASRFNTVWNQVLEYATPRTADTLTGLATWFDNVDLSFIPSALRNLMTGQFGEAMDDLSPILGTGFRDIFNQFFSTDVDFSAVFTSAETAIRSGFRVFFEEIVPTASEVTGYMAGRTAGVVAGIGNWLFGLVTGGGNVFDFREFAQRIFVQPLLTGFNNALIDMGLSTAWEDPLSAMYVRLRAWFNDQDWVGIARGAWGELTRITGLINWSFIGSQLMSIGTTLFNLARNAFNSVDWGGMLTGITTAGTNLITPIMNWVRGQDWAQVADGLVGGIAGSFTEGEGDTSLAQIGVNLISSVIDGARDFITNIEPRYFSEAFFRLLQFDPAGAVEVMRTLLGDSITNALLGFFGGELDLSPITESASSFLGSVWNWIWNDVAPEVMRGTSYSLVWLGARIADLIGMAFNGVKDADWGTILSNSWDWVISTIWRPILDGIYTAFVDEGWVQEGQSIKDALSLWFIETVTEMATEIDWSTVTDALWSSFFTAVRGGAQDASGFGGDDWDDFLTVNTPSGTPEVEGDGWWASFQNWLTTPMWGDDEGVEVEVPVSPRPKAMSGEDRDTGFMKGIEEGLISDLSKYTPSEEMNTAYRLAMDTMTPDGETIDTTAFVEGALMPLEQAWLQRFGAEEGSLVTSWKTFETGVITGFLTISSTIASFVSSAVPATQGWALATTGALDTVRMSVIQLTTDMKMLANAINSMGDVQISVAVNKPDGSHQAGLDSVPYDGYLATLHKGERVMTAPEARRMDRMSGQLASGSVETTTKIVTNNNQVIVQGVQDVDSFIAELGRRGIEIQN